MIKERKFLLSIISISVIVAISCNGNRGEAENQSTVIHPEWVKSAVIYEVNVRQFSPEGTFRAFENHIPRLDDLGVDILWFMPIHPIGEKERKGELGSYYSVKDYKGVNPEFGTLEDFKRVVESAHSAGMKVIIDWVANHTSRDAVWLNSNPEWYVMDTITNSPLAPFDWSDVAKLDFSNIEVREAMLDAMKYWVTEGKVDGFRCDVASEVPVDFWEYAVKELKKINPDLFMLAEAESPVLQINAFNMYYGWHFHHIKNKIAKGDYGLDSLRSYMKRGYSRFPSNTIPMFFTSNHDENSWNGTEFDRLGYHTEQMAVLTFLMPGMPLLYNGQEAGFNRKLEFFVKDSIDWVENSAYTTFYKKLISFKKSNSVLDVPSKGIFIELINDKSDSIYSFQRSYGKNSIVAIFNFGSEKSDVTIEGIEKGKYFEMNINEIIDIESKYTISIPPYGYVVYYK
ncbi:MAG: alpha-amylase family glycosyl hydrolase [Bacteroidales bacterium]|nr:alpha-amylase family glycosyl hydrolase [Bacteroidales bacterium]